MVTPRDISKDEMVYLHQSLWKLKGVLEKTGLKVNLKKYEAYNVFAWETLASSKSHAHAIKLLAVILAKEAVSSILEKRKYDLNR